MGLDYDPSLATVLPNGAPVDKANMRDALAQIEAAIDAEEAARINATRDAGILPLTNAAGTANAITADIAPAIPGVTLSNLSTVELIPGANNTGAVTLNVGGAGAWPVQRRDGSPVQAGDIRKDRSLLLRRRSNAWRMIDVADSEPLPMANVAGLQGALDLKASAAGLQAEASARAIADQKAAADVARLGEQIADPIRKAALLPTHRPGDTPWMHSSGIAGGDPNALVPLTNVTVTGEGAVARIDGSGVISDRRLRAMEPDRQYGVRFALRRAVNPPDPAGDAVRLAIAWYDRFGSLSGTTELENLSPLTTAMGRQSRFFIVSRLPGGDVVDVPAGAVYGRPFIQTYGAGGQTDIEVIDWEDVTGNEVWSPDVREIQDRVVALESLDVGARLGALEVEAGTSANLRFASEADAAAASIPASVDTLEIVGVGALRRSQSGYLQTADGSEWEAFGSVRKSQFSATRAPLPTDDETQGYAIGSRWQFEGQEWIRGASGWIEQTRGELAAPRLVDTSPDGIVALQNVVDRAAEAVDGSRSYPQVAAGAVIPAGRYIIPAGQTLILRRGVRLRGTSRASTRITHLGGGVPAMQMDREQPSNTHIQLEDFELVAGDTVGAPLGIDCFGNVRNGHLKNLTVRGFGTNVRGNNCWAMSFQFCDFQKAADYNVDLEGFTAGLFMGGRNDEAGIANLRLRGGVHTLFLGGFYQRARRDGMILEDVASATLQGVYFEGNGYDGGNYADIDWKHGPLTNGTLLSVNGCYGTATTGSDSLRFIKARTSGSLSVHGCHTYIGGAPARYVTAIEGGALLKKISVTGSHLHAENRITHGTGTMVVDDFTGQWVAGDQGIDPTWSSLANLRAIFDAPANRRLEHVFATGGVPDWFFGRGDADEAFPGDYYISRASGGGFSPQFRISKETGRTFLRPPGPYADDAAAAAAGVPLQGIYLKPSGVDWRRT